MAAINVILERSKTAYQKTGKAYKRSALATFIMGSIFLFVGVIPMFTGSETKTLFLAVLGGVFILWSFFSYTSGKQIEKVESNSNKPIEPTS